jgi:hypothetical protein
LGNALVLDLAMAHAEEERGQMNERLLIAAYREELSNAAKALGFDVDRPSGGRVFLAEEIAKVCAERDTFYVALCEARDHLPFAPEIASRVVRSALAPASPSPSNPEKP